MARLIVHVLFLIALVVLVVLNLPYSASVSVFGYELEDVSVVAVILVSFVAGAVYALFSWFTASVGRRRRLRQKGRTLENTQRTQFLNDREKSMDDLDRGKRSRKAAPGIPPGSEGIPGTP